MDGRSGAPSLDLLDLDLGMPWDWQAAAACRLIDSALFFGPEREPLAARQRREQEAKAVCATCRVVERCRGHALTYREPYGVWGGLTERDRAAIWAATDTRQAAGDPA
jgi:WhiB family transcriptional regulator, redox-sensing transcriptional regulator